LCLAGLPLCAAPAGAQDFEQEPVSYSRATPDNRVWRLIADLQSGKKILPHDAHFGYLRALLAELDIPQSSQMLVFSKTSLQRHRISPDTPRALYFNDDTYVGYCQAGEVLEISTTDDALGAVFYTLEQEREAVPRVHRQTDNCLICHASSSTKGIPGHLVRSVYTDPAGFPILSSGSYRTNQTSPFSERWGGWYVTGTHGSQRHMGNLIVHGRKPPEQIDNSAGQNVADLTGRIDTSNYLTPHSDLVALMVLEHQTDAHNCITRANFATRQALHYEEALSRDLGRPAGDHWDSTKSRIQSACEPLVESLLFCQETPLTAKLTGTSQFAQEFTRRDPRDNRERSLREFDLTRRMFKYPCSYLVYSSAFAALPPEARDYVFRRFREILGGTDRTDRFGHLTPDDRTAIRDILTETLPGFQP
jgi:hypothetical protein